MHDLALLAKARKQLADGTARTVREDAQIKRTEFAAAARISVLTLGRWERGEQIPRGEPALRYARALAALTEMASPGGGDADAA